MVKLGEGSSAGITELESVHFKFMLDEEVKRQSVVKITKPDLLDIFDKPIPGGLYDPAMGPLDDGSSCKTCGQLSHDCTGHYGHIELVSPSYNPLLFNTLSNLLNKTCFYCFHFRSSRRKVENSFNQLKLIRKGDITGAKEMSLRQKLQDKKKTELGLPDDMIDQEDSQESHTLNPALHSDNENPNEQNKESYWDSCQLTEAISVLDEFLKKKEKKCMNCKRKNPKVYKPSFGWFHVMEMSSTDIRSNAIRSDRLDGTQSGGGEDKTSSEVVNASDFESAEAHSFNAATDGTKKRSKKGANEKRKLDQGLQDTSNSFAGPLLPSEVKDILRRLWENEAPICSYISDIQNRFSGSIMGYSVFFLETILVPPIKFRPPAKGGDSVMEHPHTHLLGKVLQSNIALGNAHMNNYDRPRIISRWMDLQQSINALFDSKTASSQSQKDGSSGYCQFLEKKEGIFRQKMMGKRVNFACRSVISPDPFLAVNETGIPPYFALRLTYPERVTPWNAAKLKDAVINGPENHPGATTYVDSVATVKLPLSKKMLVAISRKLPSSRGVDAQSGKINELTEGKIVYRHLQDGDIVLVNRQVMEHPHTHLLGEILESNIALGNAHMNNSEHSRIISRCVDLQQSINASFDSKTASGQSQKDGSSGYSQFLKKKEAIFCQQTMGFPPYFGLRLRHPQSYDWNASKLRGRG